jgi:hypothetical protein
MLGEEHSVVLHRLVEDTLAEEDRLVADTQVEAEYSRAWGTPMVGSGTAGPLNKVDQEWGLVRLVAETHVDFAGHPF